MYRRRAPVGGLLVGAAVGASVANRRAAARDQQAYQQQQLADAQAEADAAKERAHQAELAAKDAELAAQGRVMMNQAYQQPVYTATPVAAVAATSPSLPPPALGPAPPPAIGAKMLTVTTAHIVDEFSPDMKQHNIISVPLGSRVRLVQGTLTGGLPAPYQDYILVEYNGRTGKISRLVVTEA